MTGPLVTEHDGRLLARIEDDRMVFDGDATMADARLYEELFRAFPSEESASGSASQQRSASSTDATDPRQGATDGGTTQPAEDRQPDDTKTPTGGDFDG